MNAAPDDKRLEDGSCVSAVDFVETYCGLMWLICESGTALLCRSSRVLVQELLYVTAL